MDAFSGITTHKEVRMDAKHLAGTGAADLVAPDNHYSSRKEFPFNGSQLSQR
jgi:hypothetical protein